MSERTRTESGEFAPEVGDNGILALLDREDPPVATATEIADEVGMTRQAVTRRLKRLHDDGIVGRKEVGARAVVWWLADEEGSGLGRDRDFLKSFGKYAGTDIAETAADVGERFDHDLRERREQRTDSER